MLVLPFEVKAAAASMVQLVASDQARRYARSFGGGQVLLTNLWSFVLARLDGDSLVIVDEVNLVPDEAHLGQAHPTFGKSPEQLLAILDQASQVRGNLFEPQEVARYLAYHAGKMRDAIASTTSVRDDTGADSAGVPRWTADRTPGRVARADDCADVGLRTVRRLAG